MPELPEVETVCRGLAPVLEGAQITAALARRPDLRVPFPKNFAARLKGRRVRSVWRRGKYYIWDLDDGVSMLGHLGMSGSWTVTPPEHEEPALRPHDHVRLALDSGALATYRDPRRFGVMTLVAGDAVLEHPLLTAMGPEPFSQAFGGAYLQAVCARREGAIKAALVDQKAVAGLGNIYACEALHRCAVHPARPANALSRAEYDALAAAARAVLGEAIESGGSSLRDHIRTSGEMGYFQHAFAVYGREGEPCPRCAGADFCVESARETGRRSGIERITQAGRSTFFCAACQR